MSTKYFPREWQDLCRHIIIAHKEHTKQSLGYKRLGWGRIRDEIMEALDSRDGGRLDRDSRLTRQDLEAWERGTQLSDEKFGFIDSYVRKLDVEDRLHDVFDSIRQSVDQYHMTSLSKLYRGRVFDTEIADQVMTFIGSGIHSDEVKSSWFRSISIKALYNHDEVIKVIFCYLPVKIESLSEIDFKNTVFYEGYIIPVISNVEDRITLEVKKIRCLLKLTRPEFRGDYLKGYADGELVIDITTFASLPGDERVSVTLDFPNPALEPAIEQSLSHKKYFEIDAVPDSSLEIFLTRGEDDYSDHIDTTDFHREYFRKLDMRKIDKYENIIEKLLITSYKGYIF